MKILIVGHTAEGKSTIAQLINKALNENRFTTIVKDTLDEEEAHLDKKLRTWHQNKRLGSLREKNIKIIIETVPIMEGGIRCYDGYED